MPYQSAAYGILGLAPSSELWEGFTDPYTLQGFYNIALSNAVDSSSVSLGAKQDMSLVEGTTSISMSTVYPNSYSYPLFNVSFGEVYSDNTEYFVGILY